MPVGAVEVWYRINQYDEIAFVDDAWREVAAELPPAVAPEGVDGRSLWAFIGDDVTRRLYKQILIRVRGGRTAEFTLR